MLELMSMAPPELVVLDTETTGLDPCRDRVIEIGAVRLDARLRVVDRFTTLVDPGGPVPLQIARLTGIADTDLADAPGFADAYVDLLSFVGDAPIVGQNLDFDLAMLAAAAARRRARPPPPAAFDTLSAALVLFPELDRHGLAALAGALGLGEPPHRALADAEVTAGLLAALLHRSVALPEAERTLLTAAGWTPLRLLDTLPSAAAVAPACDRCDAAAAPDTEPSQIAAAAGATAAAPVVPGGERPEPLACDPDDWRAMLSGDGPLATRLEGFAVRRGQVELAEAAAGLLAGGGLGVFEAGTGMGKSLAYLLPAACRAAASGSRVVVSTKTKALQRQLAERELPLVAACLPAGFRWQLLMGRENYLCRRRLGDAVEAAAAGLPDPDRLLALAWLSGRARRGEVDLSSLPYGAVQSLPALADTAREVRSSSASCLGRRCRMRGDCLWRRSRTLAQRAHLVCVNHALLLTAGDALPVFDDLVVDEAHLLPDEAVSAFSQRVDGWLLDELLAELRGRRGQRPLAAVARAASDAGPPDARAAPMRAADGLEAAGRDLPGLGADLGAALRRLFDAQADDRDGDRDEGYGRSLLITPGLQEQSAFDPVAVACDTLAGGLNALAAAAEAATDLLADDHRDKPRLATVAADAAAAASVVAGAAGLLTPDQVCWAELPPAAATAGRRAAPPWAVQRAPLSPAPLVRDRLWDRLRTGVLVSATLGVAGSFGYFREQAGLAADLDVTERVFPSPFDYRRQAVLVLEHDPGQRREAGQRPARLADRLRRLTELTGGRLLALFTNRRELEQVTALVGPHVEDDGVVVLAQGVHGSAAALADEFRSHPATVLLGVDALWTGQDFPGDALVCLVIARLPFPRQDARFQARRRAAEAEGRDWFRTFYLPEAVLRFRQGFGRLIRTESDVGVVAVLDSRLARRTYQREFLDSLPDLEIVRATPGDLPAVVATALARLGALPLAGRV